MRGRALTVSLAAVLALGGCGGDEEPSGGSPTAGVSPDAGPTAGAASAPTTSGATSDPTTSGGRELIEVEGLSTQHFTGPLRYSYEPPLGGAHSPYALTCGVYDEPVASESAVHSLEHGAVWLTYRDGVDPEPLAELAEIEPDYVLVSPFPGQPAPVIATAWGIQLRVQSPTDPELEEFVEEYAGGGQGGEPGAACAGVTPEQAQQVLDATPPDPDAPDPADAVDDG